VRRVLLLVLAVLVLPACAASRAQTRGAANLPPGSGVVSKEVDGDTVHVLLASGDESVRLIGIDTPETHGRNGLVECFGKEAAAQTARLIPVGTPVRVVRDAELRDRYGRLLAYVYRAKDNLFVNLELARTGYADVLTYPPNVAHTSEFVAAVASARDANAGLWQACGSADVPVEP
jgi:micrococcal nuclease